MKALSSTFSSPTVPWPLPDDLRTTIQDFLDRYADIDDHDSQRLHEELLSLYMRHVAGSSEKPFIAVLRLMRPALTGEARWSEWWDLVLKPTIDGVGHKRHEVEDAKHLIQSLLWFEADEDKDGDNARLSNLFLKNIVDIYLARTKIPSSAEDVISAEDDFVSHEVESILVAFGRRMPRELLQAIDDLFVQKQHRTQALILLNAFVRLQTPHLHLVLETSLIQHLEKCLLIDTSSTVIGQALMALIMFLPHITAVLTAEHHLPKLFLIYSRILCWDKFGNPEQDTASHHSSDEGEEGESEEDEPEAAWEALQQSTDYPDTSPPTLLHYFTFLYGLFPLNFMSFVRKPRKFLKSLNFPGAEDFDLDPKIIHSRTEPYRRVHLLHPNMFTTTIEEELTENRWLNSDPADVVMDCMDLCVAVSTTLQDPGPPPSTKLPDLPVPPIPDAPSTDFSLDDGTTINEPASSWRNTQSTMFAPVNDQPEIPESFEIPPKTKSIKSAKSASPLLKCRDVMDSPTLPPAKEISKKQNFLGAPLATPQRFAIHSRSVDNFTRIVSAAGSPTHSEFQNLSMATLQREIMLLRNDLNFERYLKSQHLAHIGQLQRKHIKEATAEADTQNLINTNKTLKARLDKMNEQYAQLKKETLMSRSQSKKWEGSLSGKVRSFRDDQKAWQGEEESLRFELKKTQTDCEQLKKIVERAEAEQLRAQQRTQALEFELEDYESMRKELEAAQEKILSYEDQSKDLNSLFQQRNELRNELETVNMRLNSREQERERSLKAYERRIMELESRLHTAEKTTSKPGVIPPSVQQMLDSALAANNAKMAQLKKMYHRLMEQKTELEMQYHELEGEHQATLGKLHRYEKAGYNDTEKDGFGRNFSVRYSNAYDSKFLPPLSSDIATSESYDLYPEFQSPGSIPSPSMTASPVRPNRLESLPPRAASRSREPTNAGLGQDFSAAYDASLNAHFQAQKTAETVHSSGKSAYSVDTNSSKGEKKDKVNSKSEVRVYGRGRSHEYLF